jgi:peptidoglycan/LPS O-acetylase OafA/YrhL
MLFSFQYLRVFAALFIVAYHAEANVFSYLNLAGRLPALFSFGHNCVSLFFVLSGFVISYSCYSKPRHGFSLVKSRLVRLYPTYLLVASLVILSVVAIPSAHNSGSQFTFERLLRTFLFDLGGQGGYVYVGWTLWYEMLFTFAFALICKRFPLWVRSPCFYFFVGSALFLLVLIKANWFVDFGLGITIFMFCINPAKVKLFRSISGFSLLVPLAYSLTVFRFSALFGLILILLFWAESTKMVVFKNPALIYLAKSSYSIFLVQVLSITSFLKLAQYLLPFPTGSQPSIALLYYCLFFLGSVLFTVLSGLLLYSFFEAPTTKFLSRKPYNRFIAQP